MNPIEPSTASEQERPQPEDLDLLGVLVVGEHVLEIVEPARAGRLLIAKAIGQPREPNLHERSRDSCDEQDQRRPGAEPHQQYQTAGQRKNALNQGEQVGDEL